MSAITFWIPGLMDSRRIAEAKSALESLRLPALESLIAKSDRFPTRHKSFYEQASHLFHQPKTLAIAATSAQAELSSFDAQQFWLRVDPVQMIADRDSLVLIPADDIAIDENESKQLLQAFNEHFKEDGVELQWGAKSHWYLAIKQPVDLQTTPIYEVAHKPVNDFYPNGNAAQYWRQLLNETQMLFFSHPVNEARREKGWPEINSVWPWGEGKLDSAQILMRPEAAIFSSDAYLQGLAHLTQADCYKSPDNFAELAQQLGNKSHSHSLVLLDEIAQSMDNLQLEEWIELLQELEENWFEPLLNGLQQGQIESLFIDLGCTFQCHIAPKNLHRFWRFKKPIYKL